MTDKKSSDDKKNPAKPDPEKTPETGTAAAAPVKSAKPVTTVSVPSKPALAHGERVTAENAADQGLDPFVYGKAPKPADASQGLIMAAATGSIGLPEAKTHLRLEHSDEDSLIEGLIATASAYLFGDEGILGMPSPADEESPPAPLRSAMLLHIGELYERREMTITGLSIVDTAQYQALIGPYKTRRVG